MWTHGVSLVTWFTLHDYPLDRQPVSGRPLLPRCDAGAGHAEAVAAGVPVPVLRVSRAGEALSDVLGQVSCRACDRRRRAEGRRHLATRRHSPAEPARHLRGRIFEHGAVRLLRARLANGKDAALPFSLVVPPDARVVSGAPARPDRSASHGRASADAAGLGFVLGEESRRRTVTFASPPATALA